MMRTDDLISQLTEEAQPIRPAGSRVPVALLAGGLIALLIMVAMFGPPLQALPRTGMIPFGLKTGFALTVALIAAVACLRRRAAQQSNGRDQCHRQGKAGL